MNRPGIMPISAFVFVILFFGGFVNTNIVRAQGGSGRTAPSKTKAKTTKPTSTTTTRTNRNTQTRRNALTKVTQSEMENLVGTWEGIFSDQTTVLEIESIEGNSFYGTLFQGEDQVAFAGFVDRNTRKITINEIEVLKVREGGQWSLGVNKGNLLPGGNKMSGTGRDGVNPAYTWSFTKSN